MERKGVRPSFLHQTERSYFRESERSLSLGNKNAEFLVIFAFSFYFYYMSLKNVINQDPQGVIARAYAFAEKAHKGQKRKSGEPYLNHPFATADTLNNWLLDNATIAAGLLHDAVEDTTVTIDDVRKEFGDEIAFLVDGVTKLGAIKYRGAEGKAENMRKMILALSRDLRVVFIKLADRLNNMRTLSALPPVKQKRIALETDEIYASLAYRLGMQNVSGELQDLAFLYLYPKEYQWLITATREHYKSRLAYLQKIKPDVETLLKKNGVSPIQIDFRAKRYSSLYKKLLRHGMNIEKIYDLVAMRIIVETIPECYAVMGIIHEQWPPLPGRIKDYIAMPKPNTYRSLHTTVIGPEDKIVEFQIRTQEMHEENEYGVAAHWIYKTKSSEKPASRKNDTEDVAWVQQLQSWQEHFSGKKIDPEEFIRAMKIDFFKERIFAITPRGDVIDLPIGATPVDFAYHVHSEIGNACTGARVNSMLVPLDHELRSGDMVTIITQKGKRPTEAWLKFVKTTLARERIRAAVREKNLLARGMMAPTHAELKIITEDRVGFIKDISMTIARNHMNITAFHTENPKGGRFPFNKVEIQSIDKPKIEKLILKLRKMKGVKEISYKLI
jgi:GTP pyrophosphokinase